MAVTETIQELLQGIDDAQYGRDMRQYIHKGIQKCYEEGSAGETDLTARQAIENLLGNFATVETSSTASRAYEVGENLVYDNVMYKVITAIAQGGTITPGTNVQTTTVAAACDEAVQKAEEAVSTAETGVLNITADSTYGFEGRLRKIGKVATLVLGCSGSSAVFPEPHTGLFLPLEIGTFPSGFEPVAGDMGAPVKITYYGSGTPTTAWGSVYYNEFVSGDGNKLFIEEGSSSNRFSFESVVITYLTA